MSTVATIGGGVAGCPTGYLLERKHVDVRASEKTEVGRLLRQVGSDSGFHCDSAPHLPFCDPEEESVVDDLFEEFTALEDETL